jgi:GNAT superfamily N-acetyltransferase
MMYAVAKDAVRGWCVESQDARLQGLIAISTTPYYFSELITASDLAFFVPERDPRITFALMNAAETWCQQNGIHSLTLGVTAPAETLPIGKVYERKGYARWGEVYRKEFV